MTTEQYVYFTYVSVNMLTYIQNQHGNKDYMLAENFTIGEKEYCIQLVQKDLGYTIVFINKQFCGSFLNHISQLQKIYTMVESVDNYNNGIYLNIPNSIEYNLG